MDLTVALDARLVDRPMTGDSSYWRGLVKALFRSSGGVRCLLFSNTSRPSWIPDADHVRWIVVPSSSDRWWSLTRFPLAARRHGARVLHTQYTLSPLAGRHGVTTVHDVSFFIGPQWFSTKDRVLLRRTVPASVRRAAAVLTVSETSRREIERFIPPARGKTHVTPNALGDNIRPRPLAEAEAEISRISIERPYLLTVGTRWPRKNMALAVEASREAGIRLVVVGKKGWGEDLAGPVYTGYVDDAVLTSLYQCASLYLAPAFHEGFGIPLLEAFACGCPVLCSSGGALPETAGGAGEVAEGFTSEEWSGRIRRLLSDSSKLDEMRRRGLERVKDFDWSATARTTVDVYREAAR